MVYPFGLADGGARLELQARVLSPESRRLVGMVQWGSCKRAVDIGCGTGEFGREVATQLRPDSSIIGVDMDRQAVSEATARATRQSSACRHDYVHARIEEWDGEGAQTLMGRFILSYVERCAETVLALADRIGCSEFLFVEWYLGLVPACYPSWAALERVHRLVLQCLRGAGVDCEAPLRFLAAVQQRGDWSVSMRVEWPRRASTDGASVEYLLATGASLAPRMVESGLLHSIGAWDALASQVRREAQDTDRIMFLSPLCGVFGRRK